MSTDVPHLRAERGWCSGSGRDGGEIIEIAAAVELLDRLVGTHVRVLQGDNDTGAISLQGDQVVLDVGEVIDQVKQRLVARGLTVVENVPIPEVEKQIVLLDAPQLSRRALSTRSRTRWLGG